jgi:hypothetical protein
MENGAVVVDRLRQIQHSLLTSLDNIQEELRRRNENDSYKEIYIDHITRVRNEATTLEDQIRKLEW